MKNTDYASLDEVLNRAYDRAAVGKGAERHADGKPFDQQPMQDIIRLHGIGFATGQATKKLEESRRMERPAAVNEMLDAIVYIAGAIIHLENNE